MLGTVRVLVLAPRLRATEAVLLELPVMLAASWVVSGWLIRLAARAHGLQRQSIDDVETIGRLPQGYVQNAPVLGTYAKRIGAGELATVKGRELAAEDRRRARAIEQLMWDFRADDALELVTDPGAWPMTHVDR